MTSNIESIYKRINEFITSNDTFIEIPETELSTKQHSDVCEYLKSFGIHKTVSKEINDNKLIIYREQFQEFTKQITNRDIDFFAKYSKLPFPIHDPLYVDYYIELYDTLYGCKELWELFKKESKEFSLREEAGLTRKKIIESFEKNINYQQILKKKLNGPDFKIKGDVYNLHNKNKYFLSIDIRSANFTTLADACPELFINSEGNNLEWFDFVGLFTKSIFIARSKYFRELLFGHTEFVKRARVLQEIMMDHIHNKIISSFNDHSIIELKMKQGDELVYEIKCIETFSDLLCKINEILGFEICKKLHFRVFLLNEIEKTGYFIKTFCYNSDWENNVFIDPSNLLIEKIKSHDTKSSDIITDFTKSLDKRIEFKKVPLWFMPQIIKWYKKEKIQKNDTLFVHDGFLSQFLVPLFDQTIY